MKAEDEIRRMNDEMFSNLIDFELKKSEIIENSQDRYDQLFEVVNYFYNLVQVSLAAVFIGILGFTGSAWGNIEGKVVHSSLVAMSLCGGFAVILTIVRTIVMMKGKHNIYTSKSDWPIYLLMTCLVIVCLTTLFFLFDFVDNLFISKGIDPGVNVFRSAFRFIHAAYEWIFQNIHSFIAAKVGKFCLSSSTLSN